MMRSLLLSLLALAPAVQESSAPLRFVACPVYRDTDNGRKSGCWLTSDPATGTRYDVTGAPTKPDWNHAILVEGKVSADATDHCGGRVLDPVRVSVLEGACTRHMLPAEGYKGRRFALPERNVRPLYQPRKQQAKPFVEGRFTVPFDLQSSFISYQISDYYLDATINYALDVQPATIEIAGSAQTRPAVVSGVRLVEEAALARARAEVVRKALILRGIPATRVRVVERLPGPFVAGAFDGLDWPVDRRVDVRIRPE